MDAAARGDDRLPDEDLVAASRGGSHDAFGELFERHYPTLQRMLLMQEHDQELSHDVAQEAFFIAYRRLDQLKEDRLFRPWLYQIARNLLRESWRKKQHRKLVSLEDIQEKIGILPRQAWYHSAEIQQYPERELIQQVLEKLSPVLREALLLHYLGGYSNQEIADITGISPAAAQRRAHRAKREFQRWYSVFATVESAPRQSSI